MGVPAHSLAVGQLSRVRGFGEGQLEVRLFRRPFGGSRAEAGQGLPGLHAVARGQVEFSQLAGRGDGLLHVAARYIDGLGTRKRRRLGSGNRLRAQIAGSAKQDGSMDDEQSNAPAFPIGTPTQTG